MISLYFILATTLVGGGLFCWYIQRSASRRLNTSPHLLVVVETMSKIFPPYSCALTGGFIRDLLLDANFGHRPENLEFVFSSTSYEAHAYLKKAAENIPGMVYSGSLVFYINTEHTVYPQQITIYPMNNFLPTDFPDPLRYMCDVCSEAIPLGIFTCESVYAILGEKLFYLHDPHWGVFHAFIGFMRSSSKTYSRFLTMQKKRLRHLENEVEELSRQNANRETLEQLKEDHARVLRDIEDELYREEIERAIELEKVKDELREAREENDYIGQELERTISRLKEKDELLKERLDSIKHLEASVKELRNARDLTIDELVRREGELKETTNLLARRGEMVNLLAGALSELKAVHCRTTEELAHFKSELNEPAQTNA